MRNLLVLALALAASLSIAQVRLTAYEKEEKRDLTMTYDRIVKDGTITERVGIVGIGKDGDREEWVTESVYDAIGKLIKRTVSEDRRERRFRATATITNGVATVSTNGKKAAKIVNKQVGSLVDPAVTWFFDVTPSPGAKSMFMSFNPEMRRWELTGVYYSGRHPMTVDGKKYEGATYVRRAGNHQYTVMVDEKGMPILIQIDAKEIFVRK